MFELFKNAKFALLILTAMAIAMLFWKLYLYTSPSSLSYVIDKEEFRQQIAQVERRAASHSAERHIVSSLDSHISASF